MPLYWAGNNPPAQPLALLPLLAETKCHQAVMFVHVVQLGTFTIQRTMDNETCENMCILFKGYFVLNIVFIL